MSTDKNNLVYQEQLDDNVIEMLSEDIGSNYSLRTENSKTIVAALNEIHGKDVISSAVGSPLLSTDTFAQMGSKIEELISEFKSKALGLGISVSSTDKISSLIEKLGEYAGEAGDLDAALAESLKTILEEHGLELGGGETLAELIVKVDDLLAEKDEVIEDLNTKADVTENGVNELYKILNLSGCDVNETDDLSQLVDVLMDRTYHPLNVKQVVCGGSFIYVLKNDGTVWTCGFNENGELGTNDTTSDYVPYFEQVSGSVGTDVKQIACGLYNAYILKNDGSLYATGDNSSGQIGINSTTDSIGFSKITTDIDNDVDFVACGDKHVMIIKKDGSLWACGENACGQLGLNSTTDSKVFTQVTENINNDVKYVACSWGHTMIIKNDGSLWACGENSTGQLGLGDTTDRKVFTQVTNNINNDVKQVSCGAYPMSSTHYGNSMIIKNDGSLWVCGYNKNYQLGLNSTTTEKSFVMVNSMEYDNDYVECCGQHSLLLKTDGSLWSCGYNDCIQTGFNTSATNITEFRNVSAVYTGIFPIISISGSSCDATEAFSAVVRDDGTLWCVGSNKYGQLGMGDTEEYYQFTRKKGFK